MCRALICSLLFIAAGCGASNRDGATTRDERRDEAHLRTLRGEWSLSEATPGRPDGAAAPRTVRITLDQPRKTGPRAPGEVRAELERLDHNLVETAGVAIEGKAAGTWYVTHRRGVTFGCAVIPNAGLFANRIWLVPGADPAHDLLFIAWDVPGAGDAAAVSRLPPAVAYRRASATRRGERPMTIDQ